jgi:ABC-2 type transport system permease protein
VLWPNVLAANVRKVAIELLRYLPNTLSMIVTIYAIFLIFLLGVRFLGGPDPSTDSVPTIIVSVVLWYLALMAMQGIGWEITSEATRGTLEQLYMSPVAPWRILLARMIGSVALHMVVYVLILVLIMATTGRWLHIDLLTLTPLFALTLTGMIGVGFMIAGLALVFKQIQAFLQIVQFVFFGLVAVPVGLSPWLELAPIVRGATMIRDAMTAGTGLLEFGGAAWALLALNAAATFALGVLLYHRAERRAMNRGLLGQY